MRNPIASSSHVVYVFGGSDLNQALALPLKLNVKSLRLIALAQTLLMFTLSHFITKSNN